MRFSLFKPQWIYGTCRDRPARKHRRKGNVQFILWKAGEQGHKEDYWIDFDSSWWDGFTEIKSQSKNTPAINISKSTETGEPRSNEG